MFLSIGLRVTCLEKLIGEFLLAPARQPVVAQQPLLELREARVDDVGRVGDAAECFQQPAPAVAHDADDLVSHRQEGAYTLDVHGHRLRLHEVPQQILARQCVLEQHHPEVAPPVGRVHHHHDPSRSVDSCHRPVPVYLPLDGLDRAAMLVRHLGVCLPQRHVFLPKALAA